MKYRKYKLEFSGPQGTLAKVQDIPRMWDNLGKARAAGRAAREQRHHPEVVKAILGCVQLERGEGDYYTCPDVCVPWPAHPHYEGKVWEWMLQNVDGLPRPILFWNIGA